MSRAPHRKSTDLSIEADVQRPVRQRVLEHTKSTEFPGWWVSFLACGHGLFRASGSYADNRDCRQCGILEAAR